MSTSETVQTLVLVYCDCYQLEMMLFWTLTSAEVKLCSGSSNKCTAHITVSQVTFCTTIRLHTCHTWPNAEILLVHTAVDIHNMLWCSKQVATYPQGVFSTLISENTPSAAWQTAEQPCPAWHSGVPFDMHFLSTTPLTKTDQQARAPPQRAHQNQTPCTLCQC